MKNITKIVSKIVPLLIHVCYSLGSRLVSSWLLIGIRLVVARYLLGIRLVDTCSCLVHVCFCLVIGWVVAW